MSNLHERFGKALHGASRAWRQAVDRRLRHLGLSQAGWKTIAIAAKTQTALSQSELADELGVEGATMVAMVDRLVNAGLVRRETSTSDRRVKRVILTPAGIEIYGKLEAEAMLLSQQMLSNVDAGKLLAAAEFLEQLQNSIERA